MEDANKDINELSDAEFTEVLDGLQKPSNKQVQQYMKLMNRHQASAQKHVHQVKTKIKNRKKAKLVKQSRKANRK